VDIVWGYGATVSFIDGRVLSMAERFAIWIAPMHFLSVVMFFETECKFFPLDQVWVNSLGFGRWSGVFDSVWLAHVDGTPLWEIVVADQLIIPFYILKVSLLVQKVSVYKSFHLCIELMDGIYHQFVNDKKQNHFIHAERHRPIFVPSESKKKKHAKHKSKKIRKHMSVAETNERMKRIYKDAERNDALNGIKGKGLNRFKPSSPSSSSSSSGNSGHKGEKGDALIRNGVSEDDVASDDEGASSSTRRTGHKGEKGDALIRNGASDDDGASDDEDACSSTRRTGHKGEKGDLYRKSLEKIGNADVRRSYHESMIGATPVRGKEVGADVSQDSILQHKRAINSKYEMGDRVLVTLYRDAWERIPPEMHLTINVESTDEEKQSCVDKNEIVQLLKNGPRNLQYIGKTETTWIFTVFDGSGTQTSAAVPKDWVDVQPLILMDKPAIYPLQQLQLIDVKYNEENKDVVWIGRYLNIQADSDDSASNENKYNHYVCHSKEANNTGNIMQVIQDEKTALPPLTPFYPYGEDNNPNEYQELNKNEFHEYGSNSSTWKHHDQPFIKQGDVLEMNNGHIVDNVNIWDRVYVTDDNIDEYGELYHRVRYVSINQHGNKIAHPDRTSNEDKETYGPYSDSDDSAPDDHDDSGLDDPMQTSHELDVWFDEYRIVGHWDELYPTKSPPLYGTKKEDRHSSDEDSDEDDSYNPGDTYDGLLPGPDNTGYLLPTPQTTQNDATDDVTDDDTDDDAN
jgi:hypothetical protein